MWFSEDQWLMMEKVMKCVLLICGPPPGYTNVWKILKAASVEKASISYYEHFKHVSTYVVNQKCSTLKVVCKGQDSQLPLADWVFKNGNEKN